MQHFADAETFLNFAHKRFPGTTPICFASGGSSSYDRLSNLIPDDGDVFVLDLACGDGFLSQNILARNSAAVVTAIDISEAEIELAKKRITNSKVRFIHENARTISLSQNSQDYVLCHLAFMLMEPAKEVVSSIQRVLKPEGVFSSIVANGWRKTNELHVFAGLLKDHLRRYRIAGFQSLGDPAVRNVETLHTLFGQESGFENLSIDDFELEFNFSVEQLISFFMGGYEVACLSEAGIQSLRAELTSALSQSHKPKSSVQYGIALRQITVSKSSTFDLNSVRF